MVKRLLCLLSAFIVLFSASVPAYAMGTFPVGVEIGLDIASLADLLLSGGRVLGNSILSAFDSDVCGHSPHTGGGHKFTAQRTQVDGQIGLHYVCDYCGKTAGEVLDTTYTSYVETLPGTTVNSDGSFVWKPDFSRFYTDTSVRVFFSFSSSGGVFLSPSNLRSNSPEYTCYVSPGESFVLMQGSRQSGAYVPLSVQFSYISAPWDGVYTLISSGFSSFSASVLAGAPLGSTYNYSGYYWRSPAASVGICTVPWPTFRVVLFGEDSSPFVSDTRVSVDVSGDGSAGAYGYVENGQLVQSTIGTIYNETTNVYQNPVTGETSSVESWTYDYSDRSYTLTTEEGDTVTVTYGDSNVTINEGGTTYNVYYLVEHEDIPEHDYVSSVTLAPTCTGTGVRTYTCTDCGETYTETIPATGHSYQSAVTMPPTCTNTGVRTFTCSVCGDSYTTSISATGHTWQVLQTVSTEYDQTGQLVREGYTIYQCSTCGEQYRIASASGGSSLPLPSSGGTSTGGTDLIEIDSSVGRGFLATIAHGLTEDLPAVLRAASAWFVEFPAFYSGFASFLKDGIAGCLPDVPRQMMGFGLGMVTLIGIVRKVIGR